MLERIAAAACPVPEPLVIEIGPGRGALTARLLPRCGRLIAIELDPPLTEHLRRRFAAAGRLEIVAADVLATDLAQWGEAVIAGNLPYYITSPILEKVLALGALVKRAVLLVQKEVAERLAAAPGGREYGFLSVRTQFLARVELLFTVPPAAFQPPPKVDSALVRLTPFPRAAELGIADPGGFLDFAALCFRQKRKTLRNNLAGRYPSARVDALPEARRRAEELPLEHLAELYRRLAG